MRFAVGIVILCLILFLSLIIGSPIEGFTENTTITEDQRTKIIDTLKTIKNKLSTFQKNQYGKNYEKTINYFKNKKEINKKDAKQKIKNKNVYFSELDRQYKKQIDDLL